MRRQGQRNNQHEVRHREAVRTVPDEVVEPVCPDTCGCCVEVSAEFMLAMISMGEGNERKKKRGVRSGV